MSFRRAPVLLFVCCVIGGLGLSCDSNPLAQRFSGKIEFKNLSKQNLVSVAIVGIAAPNPGFIGAGYRKTEIMGAMLVPKSVVITWVVEGDGVRKSQTLVLKNAPGSEPADHLIFNFGPDHKWSARFPW